ncbi:MAG TPA: uracil-DNA glycosylase [Candidatus Saccharimonadales bacterium]|nr:uracil-DNA glycosylase [Candidatus Saccharimonadales bacterium]
MVATTEEVLELHGRVRECTACPLHLTRTQAVPGYGPVSARVMAVGEAPGENEDREGKPFVGAAGRLLTSLLESVGLDRRDIYITNIVKCRPPRNRDPEAQEVEACSHFLDEQIELLQPDVILLLGRHALTRLLPAAGGISRLHGERVRRNDRVFVPLYHPAAALYNGALKETLEADMRRVRGYLADAEAARARRATGASASELRRVAAAAAGAQMDLF